MVLVQDAALLLLPLMEQLSQSSTRGTGWTHLLLLLHPQQGARCRVVMICSQQVLRPASVSSSSSLGSAVGCVQRQALVTAHLLAWSGW
jgi:hypothetical protein